MSSRFQRYIYLVTLLGLLAFSACGQTAAGTITLVSSLDTRQSMYGHWLELIYREAFARLGYTFVYKGYPGGRAPLLAESGLVDGEIHRPAEYQTQTATMLRVAEPHFKVSYEAFAIKPGIHLVGWASLRNTTYLVEYRRGAKRAEVALATVVSADRLADISTAEQGIRKLLKGRCDLYIEQTMVAQHVLAQLVSYSADYSAIYSAGVMDTLDTYAYLNQRHRQLAGQLATVLRAMKREGMIEQFRQMALQAAASSR